MTCSASAPAVSVTSPAAGSVASAETVQIAWTASDADGDALSFVVQYSTDGGATYETIAADHKSMSLSMPRRLLAGSTTARIKVVASDGVRTAAAQSALFTVAANPPQVSVHSPAAGRVYGGLQPLVLDASAYDSEDGALAPPMIRWTSSIDGDIAASGTAVIDAGDLTAGTHTLTATATDSDDMTASASVTITVKAANDAPTALDDVAHTRTATAAVIDVAANDTDTEADIDSSTLTVAVPAAAGTARRGRGAVVYTTAVAGYDAFAYEICDRAAQCVTAEVTVTALTDL